MILVIDKYLKLELINLSHAEELYRLTDNNRKFLDKWLPWVKHTNSDKDTKEFIKGCLKKHIKGEGFNFVILYKNKIAGNVSLVEISKFRNQAEIGYWLAEKYSGKGLMTRSCKALVDLCFDELKLNRVIIKCETRNKASQRIPERLGFYKQGVLKRDGFNNDKYVDHVQYSMFKREWVKRSTDSK